MSDEVVLGREPEKGVRWSTERFQFEPDSSVDQAREQGDETRQVRALFGMPTLLNEMWDKGLIYLANSILHHYGFALGVEYAEMTVSEDSDEKTKVATGLTLHTTSDPEGIWFDEETTKYGRQKLLAAGLLGAREGVMFSMTDIELALPALERMLKEDPEKVTVWALPLLLRGHSPFSAAAPPGASGQSLRERARRLKRSIADEEALERSIPNDAAWAIIEEADALADAVSGVEEPPEPG